VNFFANAWVMGIHGVMDSIGLFIQLGAFLVDSMLGFFQTILDGAVSGFSWIPGIGEKLAGARDAFAQFRSEAVGRLQEIAAEASNYGNTLDYNNRKRKLEVDIDSWQAQLRRAKAELESVPPEKQSNLRANIANLESQIARAQGELASMQKDYYVRIHAYRVGDWALGGGFAHGGVTGHIGRAATGGARSNMTLVGERGPELVNLAPGSHVRSNADTRRLFGEGETGGGATFIFKSSGSRADDLLLELMRDAIHQRGGDPVTVLGGR